MSLDFLPPQAYTKETLLKAYNWLQSQSDQVKELATTPDQLVSLYLKSSRSGQESLQRYTTAVLSQQSPTATQNLTQNTLSNQASSQTPAASAPSNTVAATTSHNSSAQTSMADLQDRPSLQSFKSELKNLAGMMGDLEKPAAQAPAQSPSAGHVNSGYQSSQTGYTSQNVNSSQSTNVSQAQQAVGSQINVSYNSSASLSISQGQQLDELTQNLIREVKNELNLSSEVEALRMLVKIGYQKVKSLYK